MTIAGLTRNVADAVAVADSARYCLGKINAAIATAQNILSATESRRREHALRLASDDAEAASAIDQIRAEHNAAEQQLADFELARPAAESRLAAAEKAVNAAAHALDVARAQEMMRERIAVAENIDSLLAQLQSAWDQYNDLGEELVSNPVLNFAQISQREAVTSPRRLMFALPRMWTRLFSLTTPQAVGSMAKFEAALWNLPAEPEKPRRSSERTAA